MVTNTEANKKFWTDKVNELGFWQAKEFFNTVVGLPLIVYKFQSSLDEIVKISIPNAIYLTLSGELVGSIFYSDKEYHISTNLIGVKHLSQSKFSSFQKAVELFESEVLRNGWEISVVK